MNEIQEMMAGASMIAGVVGGIKEEQSAKKYDEYTKLLAGFQNLEDAKPPEGADTKQWNTAMLDRVGMELANGQLKQQRTELLKSEMEKKRSMIMENARAAESIVPTNAEGAVDMYMRSYSAHPNGVTALKNRSTGKWDFENQMTGEKWSENVTLDTARQMTQALLAPGEYEKMYLTDRARVTNFNRISMLNPDVVENPGGDQLRVFTLFDPNTGAKTLKIANNDGTMEDLNPEDLLHGKYRMLKDSKEERLAELQVRKAELEVAGQEQHMRHAEESMGLSREAANKVEQAPAGLKTGKLSEKEEIMQTYNVDDATALDIIRSDKSFPQRLSMAKKQIEESLLDPQDPDDEQQVMEILKQYKVDKLPGHEGYGRKEEAAAHKTGVLPGKFVKPGEGAESKPASGSNEASLVSVKPGKGAESKPASGFNEASLTQELTKQFPNAPDGAKKYKGPLAFMSQNGIWKLIKR